MAQPVWNASTKSYSIASKPDVKDRIDVIVGDDKDPSTFHPQMKLQRWDDEANVSFRLDHSFIPGTKITNDELNGVITWTKKVGNQSWIAKFYENWGTPEGAYKFCELTLPARPPVNSISFTAVSKDVDFFYQPPLTQQEIDEGMERPEEVVGSYAVYSKSSGGMNRADGKDYKVGKVGHLYRAKLIDNNGNEIWADYNTDLNETGILTISVDPTWLDNAVYPVVVDPTFGNTTLGGSSTFWSSGHDEGSWYTSTEAGTLTKLTLGIANGGSTANGRPVVFLKSDGSVNGYGGPVTITGGLTKQWKDFTLDAGTLTITNTDYWLTLWAGNAFNSYYDSTTASKGVDVTRAYSDSNTPTSIGSSPTLQNYELSIYATYTANGGGTTSPTGYMTTNPFFWGQ